jgi:hypothetical protein
MWEFLQSLLPTDLKSVIWGLPFGAIVAAYFRRRERLRKEAAGNVLIVTDSVEFGWRDGRQITDEGVRIARFGLGSWTDTPLRIVSVTLF